MALTTGAKVKAMFSPDLDSSRDSDLTTAITYGDAWIKRRTGRPIEEAAYTEYFDGCGQREIELRPGRQPVTHSGGTLVTVEESGVALTVAEGYSETADVLVVNANEDRVCRVRYNSGSFTRGEQNIKVVYTAGWSTVPLDIEHLANEVAWLVFQSHAWLGKQTQSGGRGSVSWEKNLTPWAQALLKALTVI